MKLGKRCRVFDYGNGVLQYRNGEGLLSRVDGPAYIQPHAKQWYLNGKRHRVGGPAYETAHVNEWWVNGHRHRTDGPAIAYANGTKYWFHNGKHHREDGPAVIDPQYQTTSWYLDDHILTERQFKVCLAILKIKRFLGLRR